jgi:uncharacterized OsmC-like protein
LKVTIDGADGASLVTDMVTSVGGSNSAPSPGWYLRAATASAVATLIAMRAAMLGVDLQAVEVTVDSESDDFGILGIAEGTPDAQPAGPLSTRVAAKVAAAGMDEAELKSLVEWAVDHTPAVDALRRSVPVKVEIQTGA